MTIFNHRIMLIQILAYVIVIFSCLYYKLSAFKLGCADRGSSLTKKSQRVRQSPLHASASGKDVVTSDVFSLESIRATLIRQEETIIFALIERAAFRKNAAIYDADFGGKERGKLRNEHGESVSLLEWMLNETEKLHAKVRRYTSPEEHAFFPDALPEPILQPLDFPDLLFVDSKKASDVNSDIMNWYVGKILKRLCVEGDDEQYGSSTMCDIACLQALSRRIHYGKFVAESKFLDSSDTYRRLIADKDTKGVIKLLTNVEVEKKVLKRAYAKASTYGQDIGVTGPSLDTDAGYKVDPKLIADIYRDMIIPLTKDVEVRYLYHRAGAVAPPASTYLDDCRGPVDVSFE